jgi:hypothetical protein
MGHLLLGCARLRAFAARLARRLWTYDQEDDNMISSILLIEPLYVPGPRHIITLTRRI